MLGYQPFLLCRAVNTATSLSKTIFPGSQLDAVTLPAAGAAANLQVSATTRGGIFQVPAGADSCLLNFAGVGNADVTVVVEIGGITGSGTLTEVLASVSLKSITTSGTVTANINPFTGAAASSTTYRLFDSATITSKSILGAVLTRIGGAEDDTPMGLILDTRHFTYYYVLVTTISTLTEVMAAVTPAVGVMPTPVVLVPSASGGVTADVNVKQVAGSTVTAGAGAVAAGTQRITLASDDPAVSTLGATTGAAVITDANGTIQQYLRGLVKQSLGYSFLYIAAGQATTTVKSGAGTLHAIVFWAPAVATNTTTIYDNTAASGTIIGLPLATAVTMPVTIIMDIAFSTGLTVITATANGSPMTFIYK